uniref:NIT domain GCY 6 n=1 Tax=Placozoa sp. H4 TaxID=1034858 RepID=A0A7G7LKC1_9METZ|nr:NIT domain GCY 6 [Placozoa sp. H4]
MNLLTSAIPSRRKRSTLIRYDSVEYYDSAEPSHRLNFWQKYCGREVEFYAERVYQLSEHKVELIQSTSIFLDWQNLVASHFLILAEDEATFCKAIGNLYYLRGYLHPSELLLFVQHSSRHQLYLSAAERYSSFVRHYIQYQFNDTLRNIVGQEMTKIMLNKRHQSTTNLVSRWNVSITLYLQTLTTLSYQLRDKIYAENAQLVRKIKLVNNQQILILIAALIIGVLVIIMTSGMQRVIHRQVIHFIEQLRDIEYHRGRTDQLLHQLLPCTVAEQLKMGKVVIAESFDDVTVYISDIVGFTNICHSTTPVQVVYMLNAIYTLFDRIVDRYQVYKTETIGDAYMVASGVPKRLSDRKHTAEIATMAMEILTNMERIKIPHAPVNQLRMRIGIHTGPCVAGVVGIKMPRYCLFGQTISVAAMMESRGKPMKIHISESSYDILTAFGGYDMRYHQSIPVVENGTTKIDTYWLEGKCIG